MSALIFRAITAVCCIALLSSCTIPMTPRRGWQSKAKFVKKRELMYNDFIKNGGMIDEDEDDIARMPKQMQKMRKKAERDLKGASRSFDKDDDYEKNNGDDGKNDGDGGRDDNRNARGNGGKGSGNIDTMD